MTEYVGFDRTGYGVMVSGTLSAVWSALRGVGMCGITRRDPSGDRVLYLRAYSLPGEYVRESGERVEL